MLLIKHALAYLNLVSSFNSERTLSINFTEYNIRRGTFCVI